GPAKLVLTGRAENFIRGRRDLADTISRLQAYQEAGADVLYAPGLSTIADVRSVVSSVDRPVNVLAWPGGPEVAELAEAGVSRVSIGGLFAYAALGAVVEAAREFLGGHFTEFATRAAVGAKAVRAAFNPEP
ncbi:MAG: isocitrate lyase/phosphoenolpyruvate mutase family protein, partial [Pseudonocardia sp.]|nr:isocitrate lyase/phosphoenolpyruvate mutase family protein [Pseudonocardia sp.]